MALAESELAYFEELVKSNREFWRRFERRPDLDGRRVLEVGCGNGALAIEMARAGADVLAVDLDERDIVFARENVAVNHPDAAGRVRFEAIDAADVDGTFDLVVSKDTFEHVDDVGAHCRVLYDRLAPGGELWAGFSPLYWSPNGGHGRTGLPPGLHAVVPQRLVLRAAGRRIGERVESLADIGLNGMTPADFRRAVREAGFEVVWSGYNRGDKRGLGALGALRRIPALERFATVSIYAVLAKSRA